MNTYITIEARRFPVTIRDERTGAVSEDHKRQALEIAENCDVCRMLRAKKAFRPLSESSK